MQNPSIVVEREQTDVTGLASERSSAPRRKPSRALLNFWLDAALLLAVSFVGWVSVMLQVVFPAPTAAAGWELWGLSFDDWRDAQFVAICISGLLALEHVVLHWNWVCSIVATQVLRLKERPDEGNQAIYGVGAFILVLVTTLASILMAMLSIHAPPR